MSTTQKLRSFRWTDDGSAKALAFLFGSDIRYCPENHDWYRWDGKIWKPFEPGEINQLAIQTAQRLRGAWGELQVGDEGFELREKALEFYKKGENRSRYLAIAASAADLPELQIRYTQFDADPWKLGTLNGEIDLLTGKFSSPRKESYLTRRANVTYDPSAKAPRWEKFMSEIMSGEEDRIEAIQRSLGYGLTGSTQEQVMFMCIGEGSNGKSTMFNVIRHLMGDYARIAPFSTFSASSRSEQSNDLAMLAGARFVTISESDEDAFLAEAKLKAVTGSDPITCRFMYKELFSYLPQFKIWMGSNHLPGLRGMNYGNFRRQIILHFKATFDKETRVNGLDQMLFAEASGILNWMLEGLRKWHQNKLTVSLPQSILDARQEYRDEMDIVSRWFNESVDVVDSKGVVIKSLDFYANYREYAMQTGHRPKGMRIWTQEMRSKGHEARKSNGVMKFIGYSLKTGEQWPEAIEVEKVK